MAVTRNDGSTRADGSLQGRPAGRFSRLMERRVPLWQICLLVQLILLGTIAFGSILVDTLRGSRRFGAIGEMATAIASIPQTLKQSAVKETRMNSPSSKPTLPDGLWINPDSIVKDDGFLLVSRYRAEMNRYVVELLDISSGKVLHSWAPDISYIHQKSKVKSSFIDMKRDQGRGMFILFNPILTQDGAIISHNFSPLMKVDRCNRIEWLVDGIFHHSNEADEIGNYWVPYSYPRSDNKDVGPEYQDQALVKISPNGKVINVIKIEEILKKNGLTNLTQAYPYSDDPYHLNDIQPVLSNSPFWRAGDLFLSFRSLSTVMLYRPSTGKVLWLRQGATLKQHDIQILDDHRIAIFDNNARNGHATDVVAGHNREAVYDFATDHFVHPFDRGFSVNDIRTVTQGRGLVLSNGDIVVEETEYGRILRMAPDGTIRWRYISAKPDGTRTRLGWSRYLERTPWIGAVRNAMRRSCP